jgi:RNA polymerase sigma-70 factor (ECF subfamily)
MGLTDEIVNQLSEMDDEKKTMIHRMYRLIDGLNNLDKSIILLYLEDKNYDEIAEIIGLTPTNVGSKINRIKDRLKKMNAKMNMEE